MKPLLKALRYISCCLVALLVSQYSFAIDPVYTGGTANAAIKGYDPVAYFTQNKAVKGSKQHSAKYQGATWHFSSVENRRLFTANPEKYAPQYGGYCAYAVSRNTTASIRPNLFTIVNDKLYLNYSKVVQRRWQKDKPKYIKQADKHWPGLVK